MNENEVEKLPITTYRLRLFTCFNQPNGMTEFKYMTPEEDYEYLSKEVELAIKQGYDL